MLSRPCLTEKEILNQNGNVVKNSDGTISVYTINQITGQLAPVWLTKPCCEALGIEGVYFDTNTQKCRWSIGGTSGGTITDICTYNTPFNLILNPKGNDGAIFAKSGDETLSLSVDFDYLFKFDCDTLNDLIAGRINTQCKTVLDVLESISAGMSIDLIQQNQTGTSLKSVYKETFFEKIGTGNLYTYVSSGITGTGFFICGMLSNNQTDTECYPVNLYDLNVTGDTINCATPVNQLLNGLFTESGLPNSQYESFKNNVNKDAFGANWVHFHTDITDETIISAITNEKIKLTISVSGLCIDVCVLVDNIELTQNSTKITKSSLFVSESPGFDLDRIIDNKKSWVTNETTEHRTFSITKNDGTNPIRYTDYYLDDERQVLNTKEIDLDINIASAVETDVWAYISDNPCILTGVTVGTTSCTKDVYSAGTCVSKVYCCSESCGDAPIDVNSLLTQPLSSVTTIEDFKYYISSELIDAKNRKIITSYPTLRLLYDRYLNSLDYCGTDSSNFDYYSMDEFANLIGNYWTDLIEQVIPATTIWGSTRIYTNTVFDNQKFKYKPYTTLFGDNVFSGLTVLSPATGMTCNVSATTTVISSSDITLQGNVSDYSKVYLIQMNSGSEFFGKVNTIGPNGGNGGGGGTGGGGTGGGTGGGGTGGGGTGGGGGGIYNECLIQVNVSTTQADYNTNNGTATATVTNAFGPILYLWSNGATTKTITGLSAGTYTVTVTDTSIEGCQTTASVTIAQKACNLISSLTVTNSRNSLANGSIAASITNGVPPYTYSWNTTPTQTSSTATGLTAGTYVLTVTDSTGCQKLTNAVVSNVACSVVVSISNTTSDYGVNNGTATATPSNGTAPYTYSWNTTPVKTTQSITGLSAGTYVVTVTDSGGCVITGSTTISTTAPRVFLSSSVNCKENNCTDNSTCGVRISITTTNAPAGSSIGLTKIAGFANAYIYDANPSAGVLRYVEQNASQYVTFALYLVDGSGNKISGDSIYTLSHRSAYGQAPYC